MKSTKATRDELAAMHDAHEAGDLEAIRSLLNARPELEKVRTEDWTWLHLAAESGHINIVDFWLERGWDVNHNLNKNAKKDGLDTPLHHAKDSAMTRHLISRGALVNAWSRYGGTPLHSAVVTAVEDSQRGRRRVTPDSRADQIRAMLEAGADASLTDGEGKTPLALAIALGRKTAEKALREAGAPLKGRKPDKQPARREPRIDLRAEFPELLEYVRQRVAKELARSGKLKKPKPITRIDLGFEIGQANWVALVFDTRKDAEPDGEWSSDIDKILLERPNWPIWHENPEGACGRCIDLQGTDVPADSDEAITAIGETLKKVLLTARDEGLFKSLPKADRCELGVEQLEGHYGWPAYEDRGKENLAEPSP